MKMSEIEVGQEYAVGLREWEKRHPKRARVLAVGVERKFFVSRKARNFGQTKRVNDGVEVLFLDPEGQPSQVRDYLGDGKLKDDIEIVIARALIMPWSEWQRQEEEGKKARAEWEAEENRKVATYTDRLSAVNQRLPESQQAEFLRTTYGIDYEAVVIPLEALERLLGIVLREE